MHAFADQSFEDIFLAEPAMASDKASTSPPFFQYDPLDFYAQNFDKTPDDPAAGDFLCETLESLFPALEMQVGQQPVLSHPGHFCIAPSAQIASPFSENSQSLYQNDLLHLSNQVLKWPAAQESHHRASHNNTPVQQFDLKKILSRNDSDQSSRPPSNRVRKHNHNIIERRYRNNINDRLCELKELLPSEADPSSPSSHPEASPDQNCRKQSKAKILSRASDYIRSLKRKEDEHLAEIHRLRDMLLRYGASMTELQNLSSSSSSSSASLSPPSISSSKRNSSRAANLMAKALFSTSALLCCVYAICHDPSSTDSKELSFLPLLSWLKPLEDFILYIYIFIAIGFFYYFTVTFYSTQKLPPSQEDGFSLFSMFAACWEFALSGVVYFTGPCSYLNFIRLLRPTAAADRWFPTESEVIQLLLRLHAAARWLLPDVRLTRKLAKCFWKQASEAAESEGQLLDPSYWILQRSIPNLSSHELHGDWVFASFESFDEILSANMLEHAAESYMTKQLVAAGIILLQKDRFDCNRLDHTLDCLLPHASDAYAAAIITMKAILAYHRADRKQFVTLLAKLHRDFEVLPEVEYSVLSAVALAAYSGQTSSARPLADQLCHAAVDKLIKQCNIDMPQWQKMICQNLGRVLLANIIVLRNRATSGFQLYLWETRADSLKHIVDTLVF